MKSQDATTEVMALHVKILGWFYVVLGAVMGIAAMAGHFAVEDLETWEKAAQSSGIPGLFPIMSALLGLWLRIWIIFLILNIVTGIGLLRVQVWAVPLGIAISVVSLVNFPLGTLVGVYGLWVLLSRGTWRLLAGAK